jgi:acyl carrier protein phosphodiesterase
MNFLGHAYIARHHPHLIPGNFAGDSYKGKIENFSELPMDLLNGIRLHRFIDDFTDSSEYIISVARIFQNGGVQKVGFIASDILLDHHLSSQWPNYSKLGYKEFIQKVYTQTDPWTDELHPEFQWMYAKLKEHGWLFDYPSIQGIEKIMRQFSRRIGFENDLLKTVEIYQEKRSEIDELFMLFLDQISQSAEEYILDKMGQNS